MLDYLSHLWPAIFASFLLGAVSGALTNRAPARGSALAHWLIWMTLAFVAGVVAHALRALAGGANLYLEGALAAFVVFMIGAASAAIAARRTLRFHEGWALTLAPALFLTLGATYATQSQYEEALRGRALALASAAGVDADGLVVHGRDIGAPRAIAANAKLMEALESARGVRRVLPTASAPEAIAVTESHAPPSAAPPSRDPRAVLAALPQGALDLGECESALVATLAVDRVEFSEASATIRRDAARALDKAAAFIRRCPDVAIEVVGRADNVGDARDNADLSQRRAEAAARYLRREGIAGHRLIAVSCGAAQPLASNDDEAGRAQNRSVSFMVKPTM